MNYRFSVWSAVGTFLRSFERDNSFVLSAGLRLQVTPEGDGREGSFRARGDGILLPPLSAVQIEYESQTTQSGWQAIFYGQVRQGGNIRDTDGENYVLRSLGLRLNAVTLSPGFTAPKQPAHLTVRAMILDVLASGQLGTPPLLTYAPDPVPVFDTIPDLGFDCREIKASNQQIVGALLEQIVQDGAGLGVEVRWGVGPDRRFYCRPALGGTLIIGPEQTGRITWKSPVAEVPVTSVLWYVARKPDGSWLTHQSYSPQASVYGVWAKALTLDSGAAPFETVPFVTASKGLDGGTSAALSGEEGAYLTDMLVPALGGPRSTPVFAPDALQTDAPYVEWTTAADADRVVVYASAQSGRDLEIKFGGLTVATSPGAGDGLNEFSAVLYNLGTGTDSRSGRIIASSTGAAQPGASSQIAVFEFRPERIDAGLLDRLAAYHYSIPADEPAEVPVLYYGGSMTQVGRIQAGDYERAIDAWEYRISAGRGLEVVALTGQADDPNKLAQAALIKANDGKAIITAVTAGRGSAGVITAG